MSLAAAPTSAPDLNAPRGPAGRARLGRAGWVGIIALLVVALACFATLPWTAVARVERGYAVLGSAGPMTAMFERQNRSALRLPPWWWPTGDARFIAGYDAAGIDAAQRQRADAAGVAFDPRLPGLEKISPDVVAASRPRYWLGTDHLGRSVLARVLVGGAISLAIGVAAAGLSVTIGVLYGAIAGYLGGRVDGAMMRVVDVLYGLPYVLLVVLLAVAVNGALDRWQAGRMVSIRQQSDAFITPMVRQAEELALREGKRGDVLTSAVEQARQDAREQARVRLGTGELNPATAQTINLVTLLVAIGGVSWLTMARVVRGQVLSLKAQPFMEAARAIGVPVPRQFARHLLPNLVGVIVVYATLTVPQAILQESFLSFLGIGVKPPLPSWGNLAADGLSELNTVRSHWWMLLFPCVLLAGTLLALNFVGEALREKLDPKRIGR